MVSFKKKILIIDDDPDIITLFKDTLEEHAFECETAETAPEGLKKAREIKPNLILLDLMLPGMSGFGFMRELRHDPNLQKTKVVILTALSDREIAEESMNLGAVSYLTKACKPNQVVSMVREYA